MSDPAVEPALDPVLRRARSADVPAVARLVDDAYGHYVARIGRPPGPMLDDHAALVEAGVVQVLEAADGVVGLLVLVPEDDALLLADVAVAPSWQGRGLGRRLLAAAEAAALERGLDRVRLYTHVLMTENIALYARHGYVETHRATEHGLTRVFMSKQVGS